MIESRHSTTAVVHEQRLPGNMAAQ